TLDLNTVFNIPSLTAFVESAPVVGPDGTIYLNAMAGDPGSGGNGNVFLVAIQDNGNAATVKWIVNLGFTEDVNDFQTSLVLDNSGRIYAPYALGTPQTTCLQAFKTSDGAPVWNLPFSIPSGVPFHTSPALAPDGTIYLGADDGVLYAI